MFLLADMFVHALDVLFPRLCVRCGRPGAYVCASCEATFVRIYSPICPVCGRPQASAVLCPSCAGRRNDVTAIRSVFRLEGAARRAVHELKYNNLRAIAPTMARFLTSTLHDCGYEPDVIVPVPLHRTRQRKRGYNQSELLAAALSRDTGVSLDCKALARVRNTESQVGTRSALERARNVSGAFECCHSSVRGCNILVVDDVCTTGATLESCAEALMIAGASRVWGLTFAREI